MELLATLVLQLVALCCCTQGVLGNQVLNAYANAVQGLGTGAIVGIVIGAIVLIAIVVGVSIYVCKGGKFMTFAEKKTPGSTKTPVNMIHPQQQQPHQQTTVVYTTPSQHPTGPPPTYSGPNQGVVGANYPPPPVYPMPAQPSQPHDPYNSGRY